MNSLCLTPKSARQPVMPDDHSEVVPLLPIPNRTVKRLSADDSAGSRVKVGHRQAINTLKASVERRRPFFLSPICEYLMSSRVLQQLIAADLLRLIAAIATRRATIALGWLALPCAVRSPFVVGYAVVLAIEFIWLRIVVCRRRRSDGRRIQPVVPRMVRSKSDCAPRVFCGASHFARRMSSRTHSRRCAKAGAASSSFMASSATAASGTRGCVGCVGTAFRSSRSSLEPCSDRSTTTVRRSPYACVARGRDRAGAGDRRAQHGRPGGPRLAGAHVSRARASIASSRSRTPHARHVARRACGAKRKRSRRCASAATGSTQLAARERTMRATIHVLRSHCDNIVFPTRSATLPAPTTAPRGRRTSRMAFHPRCSRRCFRKSKRIER